MNENIIKEISNDLKVNTLKVEATLKLLSEGNTIPFIARYRKEATHGLDEVQIRKISTSQASELFLLLFSLFFIFCSKRRTVLLAVRLLRSSHLLLSQPLPQPLP